MTQLDSATLPGAARSPSRPHRGRPANRSRPDEQSGAGASDAETRADASGPAAPEADARVAEREQRRLDAAQVLYRDGMRRIVAWRSRLDRTTNWSVVMTATLLTWSFSDPENPHYVLLISMLATVMFCVIEARRFRTYDVWRSRIRLLERSPLAAIFDDEASVDHDWAQLLARDLRDPVLKTTWTQALRHRLRRVYLPLLLVQVLAWALRVLVFEPAGPETADPASIGVLPGIATILLVALVIAGAVWLACSSRFSDVDEAEESSDGRRKWREANGESA